MVKVEECAAELTEEVLANKHLLGQRGVLGNAVFCAKTRQPPRESRGAGVRIRAFSSFCAEGIRVSVPELQKTTGGKHSPRLQSVVIDAL